MQTWVHRVRCWSVTLTAGGLLVFGGCGLSDQQLASIWQSVLTAGLNTIVANLISAALSGGAA